MSVQWNPNTLKYVLAKFFVSSSNWSWCYWESRKGIKKHLHAHRTMLDGDYYTTASYYPLLLALFIECCLIFVVCHCCRSVFHSHGSVASFSGWNTTIVSYRLYLEQNYSLRFLSDVLLIYLGASCLAFQDFTLLILAAWLEVKNFAMFVVGLGFWRENIDSALSA